MLKFWGVEALPRSGMVWLVFLYEKLLPTIFVGDEDWILELFFREELTVLKKSQNLRAQEL
tara:strand:- start:1604 stop:1786 length:183 start_codon:yes stop_codon:yes gene_type:complete